ncbi:MAG: hypothetical protein P0Y53_09335 [Candidatus Pseudobacter hemicellulosilyticus]|uniref:Uncharacterized protein n=1 Tax=Candidatus Pseudobacter hemicellulosilyticus TaxID=3121375 RepID=A0AAJ5WUL8_9BACT|nr:MAG: hypothetical protein P0Y53_09335 [Pseudobacter sp.]
MKTSLNLMAYFIYLPVILFLTWYVAHIIFRNSKVFMYDIFNGKADIALSTNKLFETGFYLMNLGFALLIMTIAAEISSGQNMLERLSSKIGGFSIYLGLMLFLNMYLFFRGRRKARQKAKIAEAVANINKLEQHP